MNVADYLDLEAVASNDYLTDEEQDSDRSFIDDVETPIASGSGAQQHTSWTRSTQNILAIRTLTTLISTLESAPTFPTSRSRFEYSHHSTPTTSNFNSEGPRDQQLRLSNAFAMLLSRDGENATVASRVAVQDTNDVNVNLVVCSDVNPSKLANREADEKGPFLADSALRHLEKPYSLTESDHTGVDVSKGPYAFVKECSNSTGKAWKQTFQEHAQTLIDIIREPCGETEPSVGHRQIMLSTYVVVSCHRKMLYRLIHTKYSQPYMKGLLRIVNSLSTAHYQQHEPVSLTSRDLTFLLSIQQIVSKFSHDASRCKEIDCKFNCGYKLHLPELCRIAEMAKTSTGTPIFYTEATFVEYHRLLVNLLEHFKLHLCALVKDAQRGNDCHHRITMIRLFGSTLHNMVSTQIMDQHMQNIEDALWQAMNKQKEEEAKGSVGVNLMKAKDNSQWAQNFSGERISVETGIETAMGSGVVEVEADNFDEALACVQLGAVAVDRDFTHMTAERRPMWKLCRDWLRLTVTYFTAMEQIYPTNFGRQSLPIPSSITVLAAHHQGQHMLPWKDVLRDYLPVSDKFPSSFAEKIIEKITALQELEPSPLANWFSHHFGPGSKLFRNEFTGPLHGEAIIASLIYRAHNEENITVVDEPFFQLGTKLGTSCKCCPVCSHLLELLGLPMSPFIVRGSHNRVIGCTLPLWLPESVSHEIATALAKQLRETLDDFFFAGEQSEARSLGDLSVLSLFSEGVPQEAGAWGDQLEDDDNGGDNLNCWGNVTLRRLGLGRAGGWFWNLLKIIKICRKPSS